MKNFKEEFTKSIRYVIPVLLIFTGVLVLKNHDHIISFFTHNLEALNSLLAPFFIGFIIAYMLNQPMKKLEDKFKLKRGVSVLIIYGITLVILIFSWLFIVPVIKSNINELALSIPSGIDQAQDLINNISSQFKFDITNQDIKSQISNFITKVLIPISSFTASTVSNFIINLMSTIVSYTINIVLGIVISVYLLLSKEKYIKVVSLFFQKILKQHYFKVKEFLNILDNNVGVYIVAKAMDSTIYGIICTIVLALTGSKYALFIGIIAGVTNMIPFFGPIIGTIIAVVANLFFSINKAILVLVVMIVVQQLESAILEPHFVGKQVGVPPILTIFAVTFAGKYTGFLGILLAVPVTGVLLVYFKRYIYNKQEESLNNIV
ncbi:AI-2E family transporter [Terrisporobacter hibernicus]|uniref:AI-2E family transporter n=1 Tax=Terrisporobacter hibernicus TaxID=2813371 RepID=A0AAX2ZEC4_9FIRM|nr:AI-2E family transporter [Terrisporobacter hibernicus]UEL46730.1 AI-2E family transporter [Terrisporobacter hibernicus]SFJ00285.1 Predicted PurR-regulated permease PerM [Terrisporobacter glycolicus]